MRAPTKLFFLKMGFSLSKTTLLIWLLSGYLWRHRVSPQRRLFLMFLEAIFRNPTKIPCETNQRFYVAIFKGKVRIACYSSTATSVRAKHPPQNPNWPAQRIASTISQGSIFGVRSRYLGPRIWVWILLWMFWSVFSWEMAWKDKMPQNLSWFDEHFVANFTLLFRSDSVLILKPIRPI